MFSGKLLYELCMTLILHACYFVNYLYAIIMQNEEYDIHPKNWYVLVDTLSIPMSGMLSVSTKTYQFLDEYHTSFLTVQNVTPGTVFHVHNMDAAQVTWSSQRPSILGLIHQHVHTKSRIPGSPHFDSHLSPKIFFNTLSLKSIVR